MTMTRTLLALAAATLFSLNPPSARAQEEAGLVLDREFTIGPRVSVGFSMDDADLRRLSIGAGVEMRKELGATILRASAFFNWAGSELGGVGIDIGPGFYLSRGRTAPWLGVDFGIRVGHGNERGSDLPFGFGGYLSGGVVFRRDHSTRVHVGIQGGAAYMTVPASSVAGQWGVPQPSRSSFILVEANLITSVGF